MSNLQQLYNDAKHASAVAAAWYHQLVDAVEFGYLSCHTNYDGLQITNIFDAKPVAWRARPVYEYGPAVTEPDFPVIDIPTVEPEHLPHRYLEAHTAEKKAWDAFTAAYTDEPRGKYNPKDGYVEYDAGRLRKYELKPYGK